MNRIGEVKYNNFGSKMIITQYKNYNDIDVYFPEYNWTLKHSYYCSFKRGSIRCPYERRFSGVGYLGKVMLLYLKIANIQKNLFYGGK